MSTVQGTKSKFHVSRDNVAYYSLPIDSMNPSFSADEIDATTLQDAKFSSMLKGLKSATFGGNIKVKLGAECKGLVGYKTVVKKSGTGVSTTGLAMGLVSGLIYKTTDATKNLWDRNTPAVIYDNGVAVDSADIELIDYMFGVVKFVTGYTVSGAITADVKYLPSTVVAARTGYSLTQNANVTETNYYEAVQSNGGYKTYEYGRRSVSLTLDGFYDDASDNFSLFTSDNPLVVEINVGNAGAIARGWFYVTGDSNTADGDNPIGESLTCALSSGCGDGQSFSWNIIVTEDTSVIDRGSYEVLYAWYEGNKLYYKAMLDDDAGIGYTGQMVVGDVSMSGSVGDIEQMSFSGTADGAVTKIG